MEHEKIAKSLRFYLLANELKDKLRSGWIQWNIDRERVESVAEHIYGTCILAIAIDSEFDLNIDLYKVVMMLVLHEIEEVKTRISELEEEKNQKIEKKNNIYRTIMLILVTVIVTFLITVVGSYNYFGKNQTTALDTRIKSIRKCLDELYLEVVSK